MLFNYFAMTLPLSAIHLHSLISRNVLVSSSANAMEAAVIAQGQDLVTLGSEGRVGTGGGGGEGGEEESPYWSLASFLFKEWEKWNLEGTGRAEFPLDGSTDTYAAGMTIDLTSQEPLVLSEIAQHTPVARVGVWLGGGGGGGEEGHN